MVLDLVPRYSHQPSLKRAGTAVLSQTFPGGEEYLLYKVIHQIMPREQARAHVGIDSVGKAGHKLRRCLAVFAQNSRGQLGISFFNWAARPLDIRLLVPRRAQ